MPTRRTFLRYGLLAGAAIALPFAARGAEPIRIGAPNNLTGAFAGLGVSMANGQALKASEINDAGGVLDRPLELAIVDVASKPSNAAAAMEQLDRAQVAAVVGFGDSDFVTAFGPPVADRGLPFITPGASSPLLPQRVGPNLYLACFGDNVQAAAGAEFLATLGAKTVHVLANEDTEYTRLLSRYFAAAHEHGGGSLAVNAAYAAGTAAEDVARLLAGAEPADALYLAALPEEAGPIIAALRAGGFVAPIAGGDSFDTAALLEGAGRDASAIAYATHVWLGEDAKLPVQSFVTRYRERYGDAPLDAFAALGYDAIGLLADAMAAAGSTEPQAVLKAMSQTQAYPGVTGTISYAPGQQVPQKPVAMIAVDQGKRRLAAEIMPAWVPPA